MRRRWLFSSLEIVPGRAPLAQDSRFHRIIDPSGTEQNALHAETSFSSDRPVFCVLAGTGEWKQSIRVGNLAGSSKAHNSCPAITNARELRGRGTRLSQILIDDDDPVHRPGGFWPETILRLLSAAENEDAGRALRTAAATVSLNSLVHGGTPVHVSPGVGTRSRSEIRGILEVFQSMKSTEHAKILIVEDEGIIAESLAFRLSKAGYDVTGIAESADEVMQQLRDHPPELVLMDIHIKGSLDGIDTTSAIRKFSDVPVIFISAYSDQKTIDRAKVTGVHGFLAKPIQFSALGNAIEMAINKHRAHRRLVTTMGSGQLN